MHALNFLGIAYVFQDPTLFEQALTHASLLRGNGDNYERLEFLGDRVLGLIIAEFLYKNFPEEAEGVLAKKLAYLVSKKALARVATAMNLGAHLRLSQGEEKNGGRTKESNLADSCEALIGALYIDGGMTIAQDFLYHHWQPLIEDMKTARLGDPKSDLQEFLQQRGSPLPQYKLLRREGEDHAPLFTVGVRVQPKDAFVEGVGSSKRLAEAQAAESLLAQLRK